ncbi:MAG: hypothetical protein ACYDHN_12850 [Solirubrobacteraceae bacterium]
MRVRLVRLTLVVVFGLTAVAAASAHEFEFSGTVPAALGGKALTIQKFKLTSGMITCEEAAISGTVAAKVTKTQTVKVKYGLCEMFGAKTIVTEAEYSFTAEGSLSVVGQPIVFTSASDKCSIKISPSVANTNLHSVKYTSKGTALAVNPSVGGINYESAGSSICGPVGKLETNGGYEGEVALTAAGGTLSWK